jgi:hypothetical protein
MIVAEGPNEYRLVAQNDHGDLAGQFAAHWGNDLFSQLQPHLSMVLAAQAHDNGWWHWDIRPSIDDKGVPITFRRALREEWVYAFRQGIRNVLEKDLYAGLMVSLHGTGLPLQRYGTYPDVPRRDDPESQAFVAEREEAHKGLMASVKKSEQYAGANTDDRIWFNYRMMQVFDRLSLFFCCNFDLMEAQAQSSYSAEDRDYGRAFYGTTIKPTPVRIGQEDGQLRIQVIDKTRVKLDPYPFDTAPLEVTVLGRLIPRKPYETRDELCEAYNRQHRELFEYTLLPQ